MGILNKQEVVERLNQAKLDLAKALINAKAINVTADAELDKVLAEVLKNKYSPIIVTATHLTALVVGIVVGAYVL